eukprot:351571-Chlamydomonas_euryale.AAC.7
MGMKRVFQSGYKIYQKDLALSYSPFLPILGTGLVTADGDLWQKQRTLMGPALRVDVLDDIIHIAKKAVDRLSAKLEAFRGKNIPVDMNEEFRLMTLQVIGEAVLSMGPEECDKVRLRQRRGGARVQVARGWRMPAKLYGRMAMQPRAGQHCTGRQVHVAWACPPCIGGECMPCIPCARATCMRHERTA